MGSEELAKKYVLVVLDVETTGLKEHDKVVQIACLKIDSNGDKTAWMRFVNPLIDEQRQYQGSLIHKISPDFLKTKSSFEAVYPSFLDFLQDVDVIACHNALFDWSMLYNEFKRLDTSQADDFTKKFQWLDTLRLALLCFPNLYSYSMKALKSSFNINPGSEMANVLVDCGGDAWRHDDHDAMYDVFSTYEVLKHCMGKMNFDELLHKHPKSLLDTSLFIDMQRLRDERRATNEDLRPFALRAKKYYTTIRPKGGVLGDLTKNNLRLFTRYHREDDSTDRRVVLIYQAALLDAIPEAQMDETLPN